MIVTQKLRESVPITVTQCVKLCLRNSDSSVTSKFSATVKEKHHVKLFSGNYFGTCLKRWSQVEYGEAYVDLLQEYSDLAVFMLLDS